MKLLAFTALAALVAIPALSGCDSNTDTATTKTYNVQLSALNSSGVSGTARLTMDESAGTFTVNVNGQNLDATVHPQHIHGVPGGNVTGQAVCPTTADDANSDGFVDVLEGLPRYGGILLPLDDDIGNQDTNIPGFPTGTTVNYTQSTPLATLRSAIVKADANTSDPVVTLGANGTIDLSKYVIVLHGTTRTLPTTVGTLPGLPNTATLPVACGRIALG